MDMTTVGVEMEQIDSYRCSTDAWDTSVWLLYLWVLSKEGMKGHFTSSALGKFYQAYPVAARCMQAKKKVISKIRKHGKLFTFDKTNCLLECKKPLEILDLSDELQKAEGKLDTLADIVAEPASKKMGTSKAKKPSKTLHLNDWGKGKEVSKEAVEILVKTTPDVFSRPHEYLSLNKSVRKKLNELEFNKNQISLLIRERQKALVYENVHVLWKEDQQETREKLLEDFKQNETIQNEPWLKVKAKELQTSTTELAFALVGSDLVKSVIDRTFLDGVDQDSTSPQMRLAKQAIELGDEDYYSAFKMKSNNYDMQEDLTRQVSKPAEEKLFADLRRGNIGFKTEAQQIKQHAGEEELSATPDALLDKPIQIHGKTVHWIDAKASVVVKGLSPPDIVEKTESQLQKYVEVFGPGAVLWTREMLVGSQLDVEGVSHFAAKVKAKKTPKRTQPSPPIRRKHSAYAPRAVFDDSLHGLIRPLHELMMGIEKKRLGKLEQMREPFTWLPGTTGDSVVVEPGEPEVAVKIKFPDGKQMIFKLSASHLLRNLIGEINRTLSSTSEIEHYFLREAHGIRYLEVSDLQTKLSDLQIHGKLLHMEIDSNQTPRGYAGFI